MQLKSLSRVHRILQGRPKKVSHYLQASLNRIKNR